MRYSYYPGCSLHSTARDYDESTRAVFARLGVELQELNDWNCCGATAVASQDSLLALSLPARNLALAESAGKPLAVSCNACYLALRRANQVLAENGPWARKVREALSGIGREIRGPVEVRHTLDIVVNTAGLEKVRAGVSRSLRGLPVVPYYGCQIARPRHGSMHSENPVELDRLLETLGARVLRFDQKTRCCGGSLMTTKHEVAIELTERLLRESQLRGAKAIVVSCPLCQFNLDVFQGEVNRRFGTHYRLPVIYFTQAMGWAMGVGPVELGLHRGFVSADGLLSGLEREVV